MDLTDSTDIEDFDVLKDWVPQDPTDVEVWYPTLRHHTFHTRFVPLSYDHARTVVRYHTKDMQDGDEDIIEHFVDEVDKCIQGFQGKGAFVRLSTLSPKDATLLQSTKMCKIMKQQLRGVPKDDRSKEIISINHAVYLASRVTSGAEAMDLFRLSNRVGGHLENRLKQTDPKEWCMNIVVREWNEIRPEFEFRTFIFGGKITAITHYYKFLFVEEICLLKKRIQERILDYFSSEIASLVPLTDYIIDFSVDPFSEYIKVIELNPWCEAASSALFDWNDPEDKEEWRRRESRGRKNEEQEQRGKGKLITDTNKDILFGKKPFEFRILEAPKPDAFDGMSSQLRVIYWGIRPHAEEFRKRKTEETDHFISESPLRKIFDKILKSETKKYAINLGTKKKEDVLTELREISISNLGMNYWIFSEAFCKALGQEKKKILGFQGYIQRHFFSTITVLTVLTTLRKNFPKKESKAWQEIIFRGYAYLVDAIVEEKKEQEKKRREKEAQGDEVEREKEEGKGNGKEKEEGKGKRKEEGKGKEREAGGKGKGKEEDEEPFVFKEDEEDEIEMEVTKEDLASLFSIEVHNCLLSLSEPGRSALPGLFVRK